MNKGNINDFPIQSLIFLLLHSLSTTLYVQGRSDATWAPCGVTAGVTAGVTVVLLQRLFSLLDQDKPPSPTELKNAIILNWRL